MTYWDRFKLALESVLDQLVGARLDYLARYPCRVVSQDANGDLELAPDDSRIPGLKGVPILLGFPGVSMTVPAGARVLLMFEGGDPAKPRAEIWESGTPLTLVISTSAGITIDGGQSPIKLGSTATLGVARLGDSVQAGPYVGVITSASTRVLAE